MQGARVGIHIPLCFLSPQKRLPQQQLHQPEPPWVGIPSPPSTNHEACQGCRMLVTRTALFQALALEGKDRKFSPLLHWIFFFF